MKLLSDMLKAGSNQDRGFTELGLLERPQVTVPISRSRRRFLAGALSPFALAAIGIGYGLPEDNEQAKMIIHSDERVYRNGIINTPLGEVIVDGWKIRFNQENFWAVLDRGIEFRFTATCSRGTNHGRFEGAPGAIPQISLNDFVGRPKEPDIKFLRSIEMHIPWTDQEAEVGRGEVLEYKATHPEFLFETYSPLARACERKLMADSTATLTLVLAADRPRTEEERRRADDLFSSLTSSEKPPEERCCKICAQEAVEKAREFLRE